jgi:1-acyl-sn-glycerol-3-phosphate acyltransferase
MGKSVKNGHYLTGNCYHTSDNHSRSVFDKLSLGTSAYFATAFIAGLAKNRQLALAGVFDRETWADKSLNVLRLIEDCGGRFHIDGLDNITKIKEPVVFISNHMSMLESMVFPGLIASKRAVTFVVKHSLVTHPLFGPIMKARNPITVERKDPIVDFKKVMAEGTENLHRNISVVIFPQSQRMTDFIPEQFNSLGIKLAKKAKVQIVPVAIKTDFWKNGKLIKDIGAINRKLPIHIEFGEPIAIEGAGKNEHQDVIEFITSRLQKWKMD